MTNVNNALYVTTQGAYLRQDHETVCVEVEKETRLEVPFHHLESVVCFGRVMVSPALMGACAERGITMSFLSENGRFLARVEGPIKGNVLLRRRQYRLADDPTHASNLARSFVIGKVANARALLLRSAREAAEPEDARALEAAALELAKSLRPLECPQDVATVRGHEGGAAAAYFRAFAHFLRKSRAEFSFEGRNRRPPTDPINSLLSFLYALLLSDAVSALNNVGLDPAVGYLHVDRPGRPGLALDLVEEFRPALADRLAIALVNLGQITPEDFARDETGGVRLVDRARKDVLIAYQKRKAEEITHPFTGEAVTIGLAIHVQARLLARAIRGDLDAYPPFVVR